MTHAISILIESFVIICNQHIAAYFADLSAIILWFQYLEVLIAI
jgi:hypothetical protein